MFWSLDLEAAQTIADQGHRHIDGNECQQLNPRKENMRPLDTLATAICRLLHST
jgi:hypothetical protein